MASAPHNPPFRADHVGSFLRPPQLLSARADREEGKISAADLRFLRSLTSRPPKMTIPSPTTLPLRSGREHISREAYPDLDLFWEDVVDAFRKELAALYEAGCRYVQIDETTFASLSDTSSCTYLARRGDDGRKLLLETYPDIM